MSVTATEKAALKSAMQHELDNILNYWQSYTIDEVNSGFWGEVGNDNHPIAGAAKGSVLNARILWSFAAAYNQNPKQEYLDMAQRAFGYINQYFIDEVNSGVYWSVNADGSPADTKKQIYALAFTIYGLSEYYIATKSEAVLDQAKGLYNAIEQHSFDAVKGGYLEAFTKEWQQIDDLRLSDKDANEKKTMNTHLHILEAYSTLYRVWKDNGLADKIKGLIGNFEQHIVNNETWHLNLFFNEDWQVKGDIISYGHDIEASWLLLEAAEVLQDEKIIKRIQALAVRLAHASAEGLNGDGSLSYEYESEQGHLIAERHWWVQAEAMVGYYNAYQLTGQRHFWDKCTAAWDYTRKYIIDKQQGEWYWGINADGTLMAGYGKAGFWKCPYHNSRACMELINRLR